MFFNTKHTTALCFVTCMAFSSSSIADIVISGTRVIYKSDQKSVNVRLENKGNNPLLVQSWLDTGDDNAEPGSITVPFTATPPVSRIDAKRGQTIKLMYSILILHLIHSLFIILIYVNNNLFDMFMCK